MRGAAAERPHSYVRLLITCVFRSINHLHNPALRVAMHNFIIKYPPIPVDLLVVAIRIRYAPKSKMG